MPPHHATFSVAILGYGGIIVEHAVYDACAEWRTRRPRIEDDMRQLVESWVEAERTGYRNTLADAIKILSQECGITLTHSRVAEWRKGKYTPSPRVLSHMLYRVYPWALLRAGLRASEAQLDTIEELLWKVNVADGERNIELL